MKKNIFIWSGLALLFAVTRLINLKIIPIFTDEAIYSYWAQVALHDPANRFISLEDGKQPLFIWLAAAFQRFVTDPLVATRLVSVLAGIGSLIGIYLLARTLFNKKAALLAAIFYIVLPFTILYDRMGLYDSLLTALGIYTVLLTIKMAKEPRLDLALLNGFAIGLGMITKSTAQLFLYFIPVSLIMFNIKREKLVSRFTKWVSLTLVTIFLSQIIYNSLRLSPLFYLIDRKNHEFIRTFSQVLNNPFLHFQSNIQTMILWLLQYNGPLFMILLTAAIILGFIKRQKQAIYLSFFVLAPILIEGLFNQVLYPRFSLFFFPYAIILICAFLVKLSTSKKYAKYFWPLIAVTLIFPLINSFLLLTNPPKATIADSDKNQYLNSWPAGYGVEQVIKIVKADSAGQKVYVGTEGTFGLLPYALQIYFYGNQNVEIVGFWPVRDIPNQVMQQAKSKKTYFIFNETQNIGDNSINPHLKLIAKYQKGSGDSFMHLFKVLP